MAVNDSVDMVRREVFRDGTEVRVYLRKQQTFGSSVQDWQAWSLMVIPDGSGSASGGERLLRAGTRESLLDWVRALTPDQLHELAKSPAAD